MRSLCKLQTGIARGTGVCKNIVYKKPKCLHSENWQRQTSGRMQSQSQEKRKLQASQRANTPSLLTAPAGHPGAGVGDGLPARFSNKHSWDDWGDLNMHGVSEDTVNSLRWW